MFSRGYSMFRDHRKAKKKSTGGKKYHGVNWSDSANKKKTKNLFAVMMSSGESSPPVQTISSTGFDMPDDARLQKITPTKTSSPTASEKTPTPGDNETAISNADVEAIEEATPIVQKTLPVPESTPKIERNGFDMDTRRTLNDHEEPDMWLIDCIYYTQQCCTCTIL